MYINNNFFGGTEYMAYKFQEKILPELPKINNYNLWVMPGGINNLYDKPNILWLHNFPHQFGDEINYLFNKKQYTQNFYQVIVPSHFTKNFLIKNYAFTKSQVTVIPNALEPLTFHKDKFNTALPKMIYISDPSRGLEMLLEAANRITIPFELEIFTDMNPHINGFYQEDQPKKWVIELLKNKPNIKMYGRTNKATLKQHIESAHVFAYPSTYLETSCLSLMEAMSAGLICVVSDKGALPETGKRYPFYFNWEGELNQLIDSGRAYDLNNLRNLHFNNYEQNVNIVVSELEKALFNATHTIPEMEKQVGFVNRTYSWDRIKDLWIEWHDNYL